jgi:hypothetical protein
MIFYSPFYLITPLTSLRNRSSSLIDLILREYDTFSLGHLILGVFASLPLYFSPKARRALNHRLRQLKTRFPCSDREIFTIKSLSRPYMRLFLIRRNRRYPSHMILSTPNRGRSRRSPVIVGGRLITRTVAFASSTRY